MDGSKSQADPVQARILVVDDTMASRYARVRILRRAGYRVVEAETGSEALKLLAEEEPDLVLLDVRLPDISGFEVCRRIKEDPKTALIPVLQMSAAFRDDQSKVAGLQGGADGYIAEPIDPSLLIATVAAFLRTRRAEQISRERALELRAIFEAIPDGVALVATNGKITRSNQALSTLLRAPSSAIAGADIRELLPSCEATFWNQLATGGSARGECVMGDRVFSLSLDPVADSHGRLQGAVSIVSDITDRKLMDERLWHTQKLESIGVLAGGVAHDFNNLLMGILGNATLAAESLDSPMLVERALRDIARAGERAADLTRQLLAYSGKGKFVVQLVDLSRLVSGMAPLLKASFPGKVQLALNLSRDLPGVEADKTQVEQVIMNLLINAAEAIGENAGTIHVTTDTVSFTEDQRQHYVSENELVGEYVRLEVRDDGAGMDENTVRRMFDPFFTTKFLGRGLGLSAVLGIMRGHKGGVRVSSAPGSGTTFELLFPAAKAAIGDVSRKSGSTRKAAFQGAVLVVDDEPIIRDFFLMALRRAGYEVVSANNGAEAVRIFRDTPERFSMVLLDLVMPVMSGKETLPRLLEIRPDARIVVTSGQVEETVRNDLSEWKVAGFIQKPCQIGAFLDKIQEFAASTSAADK